MKNNASHDHEFDLSGGILCLDFANTVSRRIHPDGAHDNLPTYGDLVAFARQSKVVSAPVARQLLAAAGSRPRDAALVLQSALILREATYRIFAAIANSRRTPADDLRTLEGFASEAMLHRHLLAKGREFYWDWKHDGPDALASVIWPIAYSAADLLTSPRIKSVRECDASTCAWLFLDESRNHSRRWCDMTVCGNRQKARRHYARQNQ